MRFVAWYAVWVGVYIGEMVTRAGIHLFDTVAPLLKSWLNDAQASNAGLTELLSQNPAIGAAKLCC